MKLLESSGIWLLSRWVRVGEIHLVLPDGHTTTVGSGTPRSHLSVADYSVIGDSLRKGLTGFAERYMDGRIDTNDLPGLFRWGIANQRSWFQHPMARFTRPIQRIWQRIGPEGRHPRVRSMNDHYNLGNGFYAAWLDETMTYSSARFASADQTLAEAQRNKYRIVAGKAGLRPGMRVLEIGCGWGGFAEYAASEHDCEVVAITLSDEQAGYARRRIAKAGLAERADIRLQDFRDVEGEFDVVVSIEMIESIDETQWPDLFTAIAARLGPGGRAVMQVITIDDDEWERYRTRPDFIQQYIFPGGQLPAPKVLWDLAGQASLDVEQVETFGLDYARTLARWRASFQSAWPRLRAEHHLDERFHRMWDLYLTLCETGFRMGRVDVEQWVFSPVHQVPAEPLRDGFQGLGPIRESRATNERSSI